MLLKGALMRNRLLTLTTAVLATGMLALTPLMTHAQKVVQTTPGKGGSPHEKVEYSVNGATITLTYGRPYLKGRALSTLTPADKVWRTGADEATTLQTDKDLMIGSLAVPAGTYTLYTLPSPGGWKLIVNKQTGQGGTVYQENMDLGRVDMTAGKLDTPVEQLTLAILPAGNGHSLQIHWGDMRQSVPLSVK
jgi:hypothetical protein